jgi:ParB family chromosome partitioning protein
LAAVFVAASLGRADHALTQAMENGHRLYRQLTGAAQTGSRSDGTLGEYAEAATANRTQMISLGLVLAAYEDATHRNLWRSKEQWAARYLTFLAECGYVLSAVEHRACGLNPADAADNEISNGDDAIA